MPSGALRRPDPVAAATACVSPGASDPGRIRQSSLSAATAPAGDRWPASPTHDETLPSADPAEADVTLLDGAQVHVRQLHAEDEPLLEAMFARCSAEDVYLRCFAAMKDFPHAMAARLARMDPAREIALIAMPGDGSVPDILGVAHVILERGDSLTAEYDVMVRTDQKGHGIGYALMTALLAEARRRGFEAVVGYILRENRAMLKMAEELGFAIVRLEGGVAEVRVALAGTA